MPYLLFEDERLAGLDAGHLGSVVDEYYRRFPRLRDAEAVVWCFDEIQIVAGWERFVRRLLDTERVEVFVTGSSAALLSGEVATALRGRAWQVVVQPFSFEEALRHGGRPIPEEPAFLTPRERSHMERAMLDWLQEGGFPEAQGLDAPSRYQLLRDYVDVAVLRDVVERHGVRNVVGLRALVRHLLEGIPGRSWPDPTVRSHGAGKRWPRAGDRGTGRVGTAAVRCDVRSDPGRGTRSTSWPAVPAARWSSCRCAPTSPIPKPPTGNCARSLRQEHSFPAPVSDC